MGIFPVWGFQLLIAIAVAIYFKLNKALVIIAANVSIPPLWPLIIYLSHAAGKIWIDSGGELVSINDVSWEFIHNNAVQYYLGAITLSIVAGLVFGVVSYFMLKIFKKRQSTG